ncbi:MAG TPA: RsiV family protein [Pyrinomonadaceae bacterium]
MKNKLTITAIVLGATIAFGACRKPSSGQPPVAAATPVVQDAPVGGMAQTGDKYFFRGTIANLSIEMQLLRDGDRISGTCFYPRVGKNIALAGTVDKDNNITLAESDESGKQTGVFKGHWQPAADSPDPAVYEIEGKWSKPDGSKQTEFNVTQQPYEFTGTVSVVPKVIKDANKQKLYTASAEYPQIDGDSRFDGFNREARAMITKDVGAFKTAESDTSEAGDLPADTQNSTMEIGYDFQYATDHLISLVFTEGMYSRGAVHGNSVTEVLNYDVKNAKKLALADLFIAKSKYLNVISTYCQKELKERARKPDTMVLDDLIGSGAGPQADNYRAWSITKKGLWITFDPYQVAAYAAGPQHILVPYSVLKDMIKPDGPIAMFAK